MEELRQTAQDYFKAATASGESVEVRTCDVCTTPLLGFYFCCTKCELHKNCNHNLCVKCFLYGGTSQHLQDRIPFGCNHFVLKMHSQKRSEESDQQSQLPPVQQTKEMNSKGKGIQLQPPVQETKDLGKRKGDQDLHIAGISYKRARVETKILEEQTMMAKEGMEKLASIAEAYYSAAPQRIRESADKFFWSMVKQKGNLSVTLDDFLVSMNEKGYPQYGKHDFFQMLVKDENQGLNMLEARTLYYILLSGRPFCSWCSCFIPDIYFCCSKCSTNSYTLCFHCYTIKAYVRHKHYGDDDAFFVDYTLLHTIINNTSAASKPQFPMLPTDEGTSDGTRSQNLNADIELEKKHNEKREATLNTIQATLNLCTAGLTFATTLCSIM